VEALLTSRNTRHRLSEVLVQCARPIYEDHRPGRPWLRGRQAGQRPVRHIAVNACGLFLAILVTGANVEDRAAARTLLQAALRACFPTIRLVWADSDYPGRVVGSTGAAVPPATTNDCRAPRRDGPIGHGHSS
jgi:hypothetical protein